VAHIHTGQLTAAKEWAKHLRFWGKRDFWKRERKAGRVDAATRLAE
jgi:hypothetical protein